MPLSGARKELVRTWANRGTGAYDSQRLFVTDYNCYMSWSAANSKWVGTSNIEIGSRFTLANGVSGTATQLLPGQISIPAGLLTAFRTFHLYVDLAKSGTAETISGNVRFGTAGTTSDASIKTLASITGTNRSAGYFFTFAILNTTTLQYLGFTGTNISWGNVNTNAHAAVNTVADLSSNASFISVTVAMSATTEVPQTCGTIMELIP